MSPRAYRFSLFFFYVLSLGLSAPPFDRGVANSNGPVGSPCRVDFFLFPPVQVPKNTQMPKRPKMARMISTLLNAKLLALRSLCSLGIWTVFEMSAFLAAKTSNTRMGGNRSGRNLFDFQKDMTKSPLCLQARILWLKSQVVVYTGTAPKKSWI